MLSAKSMRNLGGAVTLTNFLSIAAALTIPGSTVRTKVSGVSRR